MTKGNIYSKASSQVRLKMPLYTIWISTLDYIRNTPCPFLTDFNISIFYYTKNLLTYAIARFEWFVFQEFYYQNRFSLLYFSCIPGSMYGAVLTPNFLETFLAFRFRKGKSYTVLSCPFFVYIFVTHVNLLVIYSPFMYVSNWKLHKQYVYVCAYLHNKTPVLNPKIKQNTQICIQTLLYVLLLRFRPQIKDFPLWWPPIGCNLPYPSLIGLPFPLPPFQWSCYVIKSVFFTFNSNVGLKKRRMEGKGFLCSSFFLFIYFFLLFGL